MFSRILAACLLLFAPATLPASDALLKVGVAKVVITPTEPTWLSGYGGRTKPAEGKVHDLYAKALAFEGSGGTRFVFVTLDLGSVSDAEITIPVAKAVESKFKLPRKSLVLNVSHTHCAPEVAVERPVFHSLTAPEEAKLAAYIREQLNPKLIDLIGAALKDLAPATVTMSESSAGFASNRRLPKDGTFVNSQNPAGITDRSVPVLKFTDPTGKTLRAVLFGYACHNTTLSFQQYCGDYAGFAQEYVEAAHPGTVALFLMGCGGDQNPYPRHGPKGLEYCKQHGRELAEAVEKALTGTQSPVRGPLQVGYTVVTLELEPLPPTARLEAMAKGPAGLAQRKAKYLLDQIAKQGKVELTQTCPLHAVRFGNDLLFIGISGETVLDYQLMCKKKFAGPKVLVAGYCDDVFAYLPSLRVLKEGGYEGREGIIHQLVPTPFAPNVEDRVMAGIREAVKMSGGSANRR